MKINKQYISRGFTILLVLFVAAYLYSARVKRWVIMGFMLVGFFKPTIPQVKPGEQLPQAPAMIVQSIDGKTIDLQQQKGKVVFINFWATWCPPCLAEMPSVNDLYLKVKNNPNIVFLSVDVDNKLSRSSQFMQKNGYQLPVYGGRLDGLPRNLFSGTIPTTLVIDKKGNVVFNEVNRANYNDEKFADYIIGLSKQ
jgi:thiol-disulfide isomerase/thioredoxin